MNFLNKKIINLEADYFGIDISDLSFKVVQLEKKNTNDRIRSSALVDVPTDCFFDGRVLDKKRAAEFIRLAIKKATPKKIKTKKAICSLPESKVFLRVISVPRMEQSEIEEAIKWEIEAGIPLSVDQVYYDWLLIDEEKGKQNILTVAISREVVDDILAVLELAKLEVCAFESESMALVRSLVPLHNEKDESFLIVDIGAKRTNFIVVQKRIPFFTSSISFSSEGITDAIAKFFGINNIEAEKIKLSKGLGLSIREDSIFNAAQAYLESLAVEIEKSVDFYQSISEGKEIGKIKKIILCGGGANLKGLLAYLIKRLKKEVIIGDPWVNLDFGNDLPIINKEQSVRFATVIGLAMRQNDLGTKINLLSTEKKEIISQNRKFKALLGWEVVIFSIFLFFVIFLWGVRSFLGFNLMAIPDLKNNRAEDGQYATIRYYEGKFSEINVKLGKISSINNDQLYWSEVFLKISSAQPDAVALTGLITNNLTIFLDGNANTREDLLLFKDRLTQTNCFSNVNLPLSDLVSKDNIDFKITLDVANDCIKK
jgi:type IV pilus assembly protein PilM